LASFAFHPQNEEPLVIDSMSTMVFPHQRFYRQYPIEIEKLDFTGQPGDSILFSIDVVVEGLTLNLGLPYRQYTDEAIGMDFLPGYAILEPFKEGQLTSLAQPFDWQLLITKPYASELIGRIIIDTPEEVVLGRFDENIHMPAGITARYLDIHLAAGRSIGYEQKRITAVLEVGGQRVAETDADVRVIRCAIPETRDIAFVPDPDGRLEDFLRTTKASFQALTARSLVRAQLDAFDVLVIGSQATAYYDILRGANARLHEFVRNGGDIIIFGQSFGWPHDIFEFPVYTSGSSSSATFLVLEPDHAVLDYPYAINVDGLMLGRKGAPAFPAIINGGREIVSAGEHGSYLQVVRIGEGTVTYCGLPLLEAVAELNVDAVHMMANLLNFGHGE
jgi:hypothetical protein